MCGQQISSSRVRRARRLSVRAGIRCRSRPCCEITALEPAPAEPACRAEHTWGWRHGLLLLGVVCCSSAIVGAVWFHLDPSDCPDRRHRPRTIRQNVSKSLPPCTRGTIWENDEARDGPPHRPAVRRAAMTHLHLKLGFAGICWRLIGIVPGRRRRGDGARRRRRERPETGTRLADGLRRSCESPPLSHSSFT